MLFFIDTIWKNLTVCNLFNDTIAETLFHQSGIHLLYIDFKGYTPFPLQPVKEH